MTDPSEPVLSRERIQEIAWEERASFERYDWLGFVTSVGVRVEAETRQRVEARMKNLVCSGCGKPWEGLTAWDPCSIPDERAKERKPITRAEFERRQEEARER